MMVKQQFATINSHFEQDEDFYQQGRRVLKLKE